MPTQKTYPITGIKAHLKAEPGPNDKVPIRREIDEWWFSDDANDDKQRSLFVFGLQALMDMPPQSLPGADPKKNAYHDLSYFGLAGIHGLPLTRWDMDSDKNKNYCVHGDIMFPIWHRPYLLLYEQRIYETMCNLIKRGVLCDEKDKEEWQKAADSWRLPYWDWAMKKPKWNPGQARDPVLRKPVKNGNPNIPFCLTEKTVEVLTKEGVRSVNNPMWRYVLPESVASDLTTSGSGKAAHTFGTYGVKDITEDIKTDKGIETVINMFSEPRATSRYPSTVEKANAAQYQKAWIDGDELNADKITATFSGHKKLPNTLPESVYRLFCYAQSYESFATQKVDPTKNPVEVKSCIDFSSLENIHNDIHGYTGEKGQMGTVAVAAFDPIFWLHHCNIDRLFAIWQQFNEEEYSRWLGDSPRKKEELIPFHKDTEGHAYTPEDCSYPHKQLGYTYPQLQTWDDKYKDANGNLDKRRLRAAIREEIEIMYSTTGKNCLQEPGKEAIRDAHMSRVDSAKFATEFYSEGLMKRKQMIQDGTVQVEVGAPVSWTTPDYVVNVVYNSFELGGRPYSIRIFMGGIPEDVSAPFDACETAISLIYNFSSGPKDRGISSKGCAGCQDRQARGDLSSGQIVLTDYLINYILREVKTPDDMSLNSLKEDEVTQYLKKALRWRVTDQLDNVIPLAEMPSLKVSVAMGKGTHYAEADKFSTYGDYKVLWDVTKGRPGGAEQTTAPAQGS